MNRDTLIQADVAGLAAGVLLAFVVRVLFGAEELTVNSAASFVGLGFVLGAPVVLAVYLLTGLYADDWRDRGPWPAVAAVGWAGMVAAFVIAYQKPAAAPMGSMAMIVIGAAIGAGVAREIARRQPPKATADGDGETRPAEAERERDARADVAAPPDPA
jgi:hypothetical protein